MSKMLMTEGRLIEVISKKVKQSTPSAGKVDLLMTDDRLREIVSKRLIEDDDAGKGKAVGIKQRFKLVPTARVITLSGGQIDRDTPEDEGTASAYSSSQLSRNAHMKGALEAYNKAVNTDDNPYYAVDRTYVVDNPDVTSGADLAMIREAASAHKEFGQNPADANSITLGSIQTHDKDPYTYQYVWVPKTRLRRLSAGAASTFSKKDDADKILGIYVVSGPSKKAVGMVFGPNDKAWSVLSGNEDDSVSDFSAAGTDAYAYDTDGEATAAFEVGKAVGRAGDPEIDSYMDDGVDYTASWKSGWAAGNQELVTAQRKADAAAALERKITAGVTAAKSTVSAWLASFSGGGFSYTRVTGIGDGWAWEVNLPFDEWSPSRPGMQYFVHAVYNVDTDSAGVVVSKGSSDWSGRSGSNMFNNAAIGIKNQIGGSSLETDYEWLQIRNVLWFAVGTSISLWTTYAWNASGSGYGTDSNFTAELWGGMSKLKQYFYSEYDQSLTGFLGDEGGNATAKIARQSDGGGDATYGSDKKLYNAFRTVDGVWVVRNA